MIRRPVQDALEAYASERFGLADMNVVFAMGDQSGSGDAGPDWVFVITASGETDGGERTFIEFGGTEAVRFLDAAMSWEGPA